MAKKATQKKKQGHGLHVRPPKDLEKWLKERAKAEGLRSAPALLVYLAGQYRMQVEGEAKAA